MAVATMTRIHEPRIRHLGDGHVIELSCSCGEVLRTGPSSLQEDADALRAHRQVVVELSNAGQVCPTCGR
jgi:hypothetical protein